MNDELMQSPEVIRPQDVREAMRTLPDIRQMELDILIEQVSDIDKREELAQRIADHMSETYAGSQDKEELFQTILGQLDGVQEELHMEREEIIRKGNVFEEIENDPAKKSLLGKALDVVKNGWEFSWKHKWKILSVIAVIATGAAAWYYWDMLMSLLPGTGMGGQGLSTGAAAETVGEGVGAAAASGEAVEATVSATKILSNLGLEEGAAHVLQGVEVAGNGIVSYGGQSYTAGEFANMAGELVAEHGKVLIVGEKGADLTIGGISDVAQELQSKGVSYNFLPSWDGGGYTQFLDPLYVK